jgi:hypothetical protein
MRLTNLIHKGRTLNQLLLCLWLAAAVTRATAEPTTPSASESTPPPDTKSQPANPDPTFAPGDTVEIDHPYNPKTIGVIPPGWVPERIPNYTVQNPDVKLKNGTTVTVECPIYALVPDKASLYLPYREPVLNAKSPANQKRSLGSLLSQFIAENNATGALLDATLIAIKNNLDQTSDNPPNSSATTVSTGGNTAQLLIDKPEPHSNPSPDIAHKTDANSSASPTPEDTPSRKDKDKDKDRDKDDDAPRRSRAIHKAAKPDPSPTAAPAKPKKFLGIFPQNARPEPTDPTE